MPTLALEVSAYLRDMQAAREAFPNAAREVVARTATFGAEHAQQSNAFKDRTGELRRRIYSREDGGDFAVVADTSYAFWVQNGRGPVTAGSRSINVTPANGRKQRFRRVATGMKMLRFVVNGQVMFRRSVRAAAPRPFMPTDESYDIAMEQQRIADEVMSPLWS